MRKHRTLGLGSRTALPIVGYYLESVLDDPQFAKYRRKFPNPKEKIDRNCYTYTYIPSARDDEDSTAIDLDSLSAEDFIIDESIELSSKKDDNADMSVDDLLCE